MRKKQMALLLLCGVAISIAACSPKETSQKKSTESSSVVKHTEAHLDYDKQDGWEFASGNMQSPIDIQSADAEKMTADAGTITVDYSPDITKAENNGHSIQMTDGGEAVINGRHFALTQFHFHAESEHTVDGQHYPLEAHFVNTAQDGRIAVMGVFFKEGAENKGFQEVLDDVTNKVDEPISDIGDMIPTNKSYYHYLGSLTTPPLNENVEWYVMKEPVEVSKAQIERFKELYDHNNRQVQPLNDRVVLEHEE